MTLDLSDWNKDWAFMDVFFDRNEIRSIKRKLQKLETRNVVFCSYESRFAKSGGLGAVTAKILPYLKTGEKVQKVFLMSPFHPHIIDENKLTPSGLEPFDVVYGGKPVRTELLKHTQITTLTRPVPGGNDGDAEETVDIEVEEYYIKAAGFFTAQNKINNPYIFFPNDTARNDEAILDNSLFLCKAIPAAMKAIGICEDIVFHLQDWQTALISLTAKKAMLDDTLVSCGCVQTVHNLFDSGITPQLLVKLTGDKSLLQNVVLGNGNGFTVLQVGLQLADAPVTTVSTNFAKEMTSDLLQTGHFAPHLQDIFKKNGVYGINNGLFIDFPPQFTKKNRLTTDEIKHIKQEKRKELLKILAHYTPNERIGELTYQSKTITRLPNRVPIIVMSGRLDPLQKGFDVLLQALERFEEDEIKAVLTPMADRASDLDYFHEVACKCKGNVVIFPMRMQEGYQELQMGATFGIMPSIYEPFGAAIEYMVSGTITIARSTGGLADQVIHNRCGLLYREEAEFYTLENIQGFAASCDIVQIRKQNPWVQAMADKLYRIIKDATDKFRENPSGYYKCVLKGFTAARSFTWERAAAKYVQVYDKVKRF